ncbi:MAG: TIGR00645 family protein [Candidatus Paracaedibacteraceae bacterium]|nr:TIGR00645 family protein [Candidatus Paracaedibacteraceae bacterium]
MKRPKLQAIILWSRFLQVPLYLGMAIGLALFSVKFYQELSHLIHGLFVEENNKQFLDESGLILGILSLIDLLLVANLMVMVIISGYESFIEPIMVGNDGKKPGWLSSVDPGTIKIKVATSIVGISSIHLLRSFLDSDKYTFEKLMSLVVLHLAFVLSALFLAYIDKMVTAKHASGLTIDH